MPNLPHFRLIVPLPHFTEISRIIHVVLLIIGNIGEMMQGDVNILITVNMIKVLAPKKSPTFWTSGIGNSDSLVKSSSGVWHVTVLLPK